MKKIIILVVGILFGLIFINAGFNKFFNYMPIPGDMAEGTINMMMGFMAIKWLMPLVAVVEIIGGLLFMITRYRALGAIVIFPVMIGIILTHLFIERSGLVIAVVLLLINLWIIIENWDKYLPMIKSKE